MNKIQVLRLIPKTFALAMLGIGIADLTQPLQFLQAMDAIGMPHYILFILGSFKIAGGIAILFLNHSILKEWAYGGFFIWSAGAIASHLFSNHGLKEILPVLGLTLFLILSYVIEKHSLAVNETKT